MDYAAIVSLKHTIESILNSSDISLVPRSIESLGYAYKAVEFLQNFIQLTNSSSSRKVIIALEAEIREAVYRLENELEPYAYNPTVSSQSAEETNPFLFSTDLHHLEPQFYSFSKKVMQLKEERTSFSEEGDHHDDDSSSYIKLPSRNLKGERVGLSDEFVLMKDRLTRSCPFPFQVFSLVGMAGIGKTTFAQKIFEDEDIQSYFGGRVCVRVGRKYKLAEIRRTILAQLDPWIIEMHTLRDEEIVLQLEQVMKSRRCLLVLDDVWEAQVWHDLRALFPDHDNGSRVLLTTRLQHVALEASKSYGVFEMPLLDKEESWHLLRKKIFGEDPCPSVLEKAGKKIADQCDGLPLTIVTLADHLSKAEKTLQHWNMVATDKQNSYFVDVYDEISKVLYPSYECLPPHLKVCFLFLGFFPITDEIHKSELINMWTAEGFFESHTSKRAALKFLGELLSNNLVMVCQKSITDKEIKTFRLHSSFWYLCKIEARKNKFFHVLQSLDDALEEGKESQRRLCIHTGILSDCKYVYESLELNCGLSARFLLYYGPYHRYPVPICSVLTKLKVLNALTIRFYEFPDEVLDLVQLKFLALTYNGTLPHLISNLSNLQFLIVRPHLSIKYRRALSYLPIEIWDMKELKHLQVTGSNLQNCHGDILQNLQTLLDVSAHCCTKDVFARTSYLRKLGIRIEMVPNEPFCWFKDISDLYRLESLKCVVVNPELRTDVVAPPLVRSDFPSGLTKLSLSGLGYPWEHMKVIALLPYLEVLKLRYYAFRGPKWETTESGFLKLRFLLIEDTDLVRWKVGCGSFPKIICVIIRRCYKLEELHWVVSHESHVPDIEIADCNFVDVKEIKEENLIEEHLLPHDSVHSS